MHQNDTRIEEFTILRKIKKVKSNNISKVYRILNGLEKLNPDSLFTISWYTNIRCHTMKLEKKHVHLDI